jgi:transcription elongation GreA/GreB family factor
MRYHRLIMTKKNLILAFTAHLQEELATLTAAAKATLEAATHEESKPENEYDTRGLEASYLAGAQAKRVSEIREVLNQFKTLEFKNFTSSDRALSTALVEVSLDGKNHTFLIMPKGGGSGLQWENKSVQIITPNSLLGAAILGKKVGDETEYEVGSQIHTCEILEIK